MVTNDTGSPTIFRVMGAWLYDALAVLAIWFFATLLIVIIQRGAAIEPGNPFFMLYLGFCAFAYFGSCWRYGGQTLGMKAWKFTLRGDPPGPPVGWPAVAVRFAVAGFSALCFGLGFLWPLFDGRRRTWHDIASKTRLLPVSYT